MVHLYHHETEAEQDLIQREEVMEKGGIPSIQPGRAKKLVSEQSFFFTTHSLYVVLLFVRDIK